MSNSQSVERVLEVHRAAGEQFSAAGVASFVRSEGSGIPVVMIHGLPMSSFLYRKLIPRLAERGFRGVSFDLPGLGLAGRPPDFDYTLRGLGAFAADAVDALGLDRFHLVVHDAGGPVGFELATLRRERVLSLTVLNTTVDARTMPFPGEVYAKVADRVRGPLASFGAWRQMMFAVGIADRGSISDAEIDAHRVLALGDDEGAGYLRIMRVLRDGHDPGRYRSAIDVHSTPYPVQIVWGGKDPILSLRRHGWRALAASGLPSMTVLPAKHYLQEDQSSVLAELIDRQIRST